MATIKIRLNGPTANFVAALVAGVLLLWVLFQAKIEDFWFDEAGQYWLSQGQNHFSQFGEQKSLPSWEFLHTYNLDPPGFSYLLAGWTGLGMDKAWTIRLLPVLFGLAALLLILLIGTHLFRLPLLVSVTIAVSGALATPLRNLFPELRAYTLEFLGVITVGMLLVLFSKRPDSLKLGLLPTGAVLFFFFTSRYSFVLAGLGATVALGFVFLKARSRKSGLSFGASLFALGFLAIYVWSTRRDRLSADGPAEYVSEFMLSNIENIAAIARLFFVNFFAGPQVAIIPVVGIFLFSLWTRKNESEPIKLHFRKLISSASAMQFSVLSVFVLAYTASAVALSSMGIYPWFASQKWSIGYSAVATLAAILGFSLFFSHRSATNPGSPLTGTSRMLGTGASAVAGFLVFAFLAGSLATYHTQAKRHDELLSSSYSSSLLLTEMSSRTESVRQTWIIDRWLWPSLRMQAQLISLEEEIAMVDTFISLDAIESTDRDTSQLVINHLECSSGNRTVIILRNQKDSYPLTIRAMEQLVAAKDCQINRFERADLVSVFLVTSGS